MRDILVTIICTVITSSGIWGVIGAFINKKLEVHSTSTDMLIGLGHDRIIYLGTKYLQRGWITHAEYENLKEYLYRPYEALGGNGSAKKIMDEVEKLPLKPNDYDTEDIHEV